MASIVVTKNAIIRFFRPLVPIHHNEHTAMYTINKVGQ